MLPQPLERPPIAAGKHPEQASGALLKTHRIDRSQTSHRTHRIARLPLELSTKPRPRPMTMLAGDRTLRVGEPELVRHVAERLP